MARREMIVLALLFIAIAGVAAEKAAAGGKHDTKGHAAGAPKAGHDKGSHDSKTHMKPTIKLAKPGKPATKGPKPGAAAAGGSAKPGMNSGVPLMKEGPPKRGQRP